MKGFTRYFGIAATALALTLFAAAEDTPGNSTANLVAANAELVHSLNSKTAKQGDAVTAKLTHSINLAGTTLPRNTLLIGTLDAVQPSENKGVSKIVLTFNEAKLENGQQVPIKSTIVGVYPSGTLLVPPSLNPELQVDQEPSSTHGFGLNSSVTDADSGTLSANGKNFHLAYGTELQLAVAPAAGSTASSTGN